MMPGIRQVAKDIGAGAPFRGVMSVTIASDAEVCAGAGVASGTEVASDAEVCAFVGVKAAPSSSRSRLLAWPLFFRF